jgi:hypothetical protein
LGGVQQALPFSQMVFEVPVLGGADGKLFTALLADLTPIPAGDQIMVLSVTGAWTRWPASSSILRTWQGCQLAGDGCQRVLP